MARRLVAAFVFALSRQVGALTVSEVAGYGYEECTQSELTPFTASVRNEVSDCATRTTYDWDSGFLPTYSQRLQMCGCNKLLAKLETVRVPHCGFYRFSPVDYTAGFYSYKSLVEFAFEECSSSASSSTTTSTSTTTTGTTTAATPTPSQTSSYDDTAYTYTPYTYSPSYDLGTSTSSSSRKGKSKAGLIVGILVAVMVVAVIAVFVVRRSNKKKRTATGEGEHKRSDSDADVVLDIAHVDVGDGDQGELSPLGGDAQPFAEMPPTPTAPPAKDVA